MALNQLSRACMLIRCNLENIGRKRFKFTAWQKNTPHRTAAHFTGFRVRRVLQVF